MIFSHPKMEYNKIGEHKHEIIMWAFPFKAYFVKVDRGKGWDTGWMLDHVECVKENMDEYLELFVREEILFSNSPKLTADMM